MSRQLAHHLFHIMRGSSRRKSLDELKRLGHRRVPVLSFREIEVMLESAVEQALEAVGVDVDEKTLGELSAEMRARFLTLREQRDTLQASVDELLRQQKELSRNRGVLEQELVLAESELAHREAGTELDPEAEADLASLRDALGARLHALLAEPAGDPLARKAVAAALEAVEEHRAALLARDEGAQTARVEQLRRRIARLRSRLEESEQLLARARSAARPVDVTIADRDGYVPKDDPQRRALLEELLRMNLELRRLTAKAKAAQDAATGDPAAPADAAASATHDAARAGPSADDHAARREPAAHVVRIDTRSETRDGPRPPAHEAQRSASA